MLVCVVWKTSVSRRDCPADCRLGKLKKPGDRAFTAVARGGATGPARDATSTPSRRPKPVPSMVPPPAPPPRPPPSPDQIQNAFGPHAFSPHVGVESRVEFQTRGARHAHILLWFIAEGPLGALSHDSDSDEPQPLLYMDELGALSHELLLPYMDEPPPLVD